MKTKLIPVLVASFLFAACGKEAHVHTPGDGHGKEAGVPCPGLADGEGGHGDPAGHLHDGEEAVEPVQVP